MAQNQEYEKYVGGEKEILRRITGDFILHIVQEMQGRK